MKHILFNFASRSRPEKFARVVKQIYDYCAEPFTVLGKIDEDDPAKDEYLKTPGVIFEVGISHNKIHAINRSIPATGWDIIVDVSDDFVFTKKGFDDIIREHCGPDDYLHFPEPFADNQARVGKNERIVIMYCAGREYFHRTGWIYNPVYLSLFCDNEGTRVARMNGRYKEVKQQIFFHAHPAAGYGVQDEQTKHTESLFHIDQATFKKREKEGFKL
jgi:hypothetical protein